MFIVFFFFFFFALGMSTMKENKEKEVVGEESRHKTQSQVRLSAGEIGRAHV